MKKHFLLAGIVFSLGICSSINAQTQPATGTGTVLIEKVEAKPGELKIAYEKYKLSNGLTLIIHEDHSDPLVHVEVTYHVGSAREAAGKSGFAHLFEHMLFQGSEHVKDEEHFKMVSAAGGQMNGNTTRDRTTYFETVPSNYLETALWLESDRMGFLLDSLTVKKFEVQRSTVKNEKGQNVDNVPYGKVNEIRDQNMYPMEHPYSWPVIGYLRDLDNATIDDVKNFFMRWYAPNNASLIISGDVNPAEAIKLAEKYFGPIPKGPEVRKQRVEPFRLADNKYVNYPDKVFFPMNEYTWPTVAQYNVDEPALDFLGGILSQGKNSIFYRNFQKPEKVAQASAYNSGSELAGEFVVDLYTFPGSEDNEEKLLMETFAEFNSKGVTDEEIAAAYAQIENGLIGAMESVQGRSSLLMFFQYIHNGKTYNVNEELARYKKVTKEDVMRVFRKYIYNVNTKTSQNFVKVRVFPKDLNAANKQEYVHKDPEMEKGTNELEYKGLQYNKAPNTFDRNIHPTPATAKNVIVPTFWQTILPNGIKVIGTRSAETPNIDITIKMKGGNMVLDPSKTGLASLTASMMGEATQTMTGEQLDAATQKTGGGFGFSAGFDASFASLGCQKKDLDAMLKIFEDALMHPKFNADDYKRISNQTYQNVEQSLQSASYAGGLVFSKLMYGKNSIQGVPAGGTTKSIKSFSIKDVQNYYDKYYAPDYATVVVIGDLSQEEVLAKLSFLNNWSKKNVVLPTLPATVPAEQTQIYLVDKYKAPQSQIFVGTAGIPYDWEGKFYKATLMNFILGGNFNSRLNLNLREDKGFTYGINSSMRGNEYNGIWATSAGVRASSTDSSVREIIKEINLIREKGIDEEELAFIKSSIGQSDALRYESNNDKAGFLGLIADKNLPADYQTRQRAILNALTKEDVKALANEIVNPNALVIVVVGDRDKVTEPLKKLGYKVTEVKAND
jgi:zinc protease